MQGNYSADGWSCLSRNRQWSKKGQILLDYYWLNTRWGYVAHLTFDLRYVTWRTLSGMLYMYQCESLCQYGYPILMLEIFFFLSDHGGLGCDLWLEFLMGRANTECIGLWFCCATVPFTWCGGSRVSGVFTVHNLDWIRGDALRGCRRFIVCL